MRKLVASAICLLSLLLSVACSTSRNNGTPEHGTPEHRNITEHSGTPEKPGTPPKNQKRPQENLEHLRKTGKVQKSKRIKIKIKN